MLRALVLCAALASSRAAAVAPNGPVLHFLHQEKQAVLDARSTPGTEDNMFGFEGGRVIKENGMYYYFTAELFRFPVDANMRIALWRAPHVQGPWKRMSTIQQSNQSYPQVSFTQQCN